MKAKRKRLTDVLERLGLTHKRASKEKDEVQIVRTPEMTSRASRHIDFATLSSGNVGHQ